MWIVTGDKHGQFGNIYDLIDRLYLGENDNILVLGDMGLFWSNNLAMTKNTIDNYEKKYNCNIWFIDGNHENFDLLKLLPAAPGGNDKIRYVSPHIRYITRGTIMDIEGKKCLFVRWRR